MFPLTAGLLKKKQKKTSQMVSSFKPLQVSIMDLCTTKEKKVCNAPELVS